jgi:hypothetical protein
VVEHLLTLCGALGAIPNTAKRRKKGLESLQITGTKCLGLLSAGYPRRYKPRAHKAGPVLRVTMKSTLCEDSTAETEGENAPHRTKELSTCLIGPG